MDEENMGDEMMNQDDLDNVITLKDENGEELKFEFLDLIEYNSEEYIILLPTDEDENEEDAGQVVILRVDKATANTDEESYVGVEDQDELNAVFQIFKEKFKDEFNFIDEE